jgi:hypothetical protein
VSFTCPICWRTSYNPNDELHGYCGYCHAFTGHNAFRMEIFSDGYERPGSSGSEAGQEREVRMQPNDEEQKAKSEMPAVQGQRNSGSVSGVPGDGMESSPESHVPEMRGTGVSLNGDELYPSRFRYYFGATGMGMMLGISWTLLMTGPFVQRYVSHLHAVLIMYGVCLVFMVLQVDMLYRWERRLKRHRAVMEEWTKRNMAERKAAIEELDRRFRYSEADYDARAAALRKQWEEQIFGKKPDA